MSLPVKTCIQGGSAEAWIIWAREGSSFHDITIQAMLLLICRGGAVTGSQLITCSYIWVA